MCRRHSRKKVVATASRRECVYKRTGEPSVPFYEKGGTAKQVTDFFHKKIGTSVTCSDVELVTGLEPATCALRMRCTTNCATQAYLTLKSILY